MRTGRLTTQRSGSRRTALAVLLASALAFAGGGFIPASPAVAAASPAPEQRALPACTGTEGPYADVGVAHPFCSEIAWAKAEGIVLPRFQNMFRPTATRMRGQLAANLMLVTEPAAHAACDTEPPPFPDVRDRDVFCTEIAQAASAGIVAGYADGTFRPYSPASRQAAAALLFRLEGSQPASGGPCTGSVSSAFADVPVDHPFCTEIATLADEGVMAGYGDGTFRPAAPLSHQAWMVFVVRRLTVDPASTALKINEVDYDQPGADDAEFVEILNAGDVPVSLGGSVVELARSRPLVGGSHAGYRIDLPAVSLAPGDTFVVCYGEVPNCDLALGGILPLLGNGKGPQSEFADAVGLRVHGRIVDTVAYEGHVDRYTEGAFIPVEAADDETGDISLNRCPDGADTDDNATDFNRGTPTPGQPNDCTVE